jgi:hypothetical protein
MNFIEKISQSRIKWNGQSSFPIDEVFQILDSNNVFYCSMKKEILTSPFVRIENGRITINRIDLQQYWNSKVTMGSKILLTLFWGGLHKTQNFKSDFVLELDKNMKIINEFDDKFFEKKIEDLFIEFESKKKIAGVGYAFFSKFFQFAIPDSSFIICDQWTMKAVASYLISTEQHTKLNDVFSLSISKKNQINIGLRSKNRSVSKSYLSFIEVFREIANGLTLVMPQFNNDVRVTEEILFGWHRGEKMNDYDNPRFFYQDVLRSYLNLSIERRVEVDNLNPSMNENFPISKVFIYKQVSYYALRLSPQNRSKIGYFDNKAWLCLHHNYTKLLSGANWEVGNTKGGSESHKCKFNSIDEIIHEFDKNNVICVKLNW